MPSELNRRNVGLLNAIQLIFRLSNKSLATAGNVTGGYITKLKDFKIQGSVAFYSALNRNLGNVILEHSGGVFKLPDNAIPNLSNISL